MYSLYNGMCEHNNQANYCPTCAFKHAQSDFVKNGPRPAQASSQATASSSQSVPSAPSAASSTAPQNKVTQSSMPSTTSQGASANSSSQMGRQRKF